MKPAATSRYLSPGAVARLFGVRDSKVATWIRTGELRAVNLAERRDGRPRYRIAPEALDEFLAARAVVPTVRTSRRRAKQEAVIEFF